MDSTQVFIRHVVLIGGRVTATHLVAGQLRRDPGCDRAGGELAGDDYACAYLHAASKRGTGQQDRANSDVAVALSR